MSGIMMKAATKTIEDFQLGPIDLQFETGTITVLAGDNGAGKSTLLKMLMNLAPADSGTIEIGGQTVSFENEEWKQVIAYQPQTVIGWDLFRGSELVSLMAGLYPAWDQTFFDKIAKALKLPLNKKFAKLSQGVQQKLCLALALARDTNFIILDEPTANIDIPAKRTLLNFFIEWMDRGDKVMIISSHQPEDIRKLADYIAVMKNGQLIGHYVKDELDGSYSRYWLEEPLTGYLPGEVDRENDRVICVSDPEKAEQYLTAKGINWLQSEPLDIEEIISYILSEEAE